MPLGSALGLVSIVGKEVGSYGKQISQILKILDVLIAHPPENLATEEKIAIDQFRDYEARVAAALAQGRGPQPTDLTLGYVDRLEGALQQKRQTGHKEDFARLMAKLLIMVERYAGMDTSDTVSASVSKILNPTDLLPASNGRGS